MLRNLTITPLSARDMHQFGVASDSGIALSNLEAGASIKIITVSQQDFDALNRYIFSLTHCCMLTD